MGTMYPMKRGTFPLGERNSFDGMAVKTNIALLLERVTEDFVPFPAPVLVVWIEIWNRLSGALYGGKGDKLEN